MKFRLFILFLSLFTLNYLSYGQHKVSGSVLETNGQLLSEAIVILVSQNQTYLGQTICDTLGRYELLFQTKQDFYLLITAPGYSDTTLLVSYRPENITIAPVPLRLTMNMQLEEVVVTAQPYAISQTTEGFNFKLINNTLVSNNSVFSSLRLAPLIRVDEITGISMIGKEKVDIYINGRRSRMSPEAINSYLKGLPASEIENIEIIMNPESSYNVEDNVGVVNIRLKKASREGVKGYISTQSFYSRLFKPSALGNINYNKNKLSINNSFSFRYSGDYRREKIETHYLKNNHYSYSEGRNDGRRQQYTLNSDAVYKLNDNQILGAVIDFYAYPGRPKQEMITWYGEWPGTSIDSIIMSKIKRDNINWRLSGNVNFTQKINEKSQIKFDLDYLHGQYSNKADYATNILNEHGVIMDELESYNQDNPQTSNVWLFKTEFTFRFNSQNRLNIGIDANISSIDYKDKYENKFHSDGTIWEDNIYQYDDNGITGYTSYNRKWNDKFTSAAGARLQYDKLKGKQKSVDENFSTDYLHLNPFFSAVYKFSDRTSVSYNLSVRTRFPSFSSFNPFVIYHSATVYSKGNPQLAPSRTWGQYLTLTLPEGFLVQMSHSQTNDAQATLDRILDGTNITERMPVNYGRNSTSALTLGYNGKIIHAAWNVNASLSVYYTDFKNKLNWIEFNRNDASYIEFQLVNIFTLSARRRWQLATRFNSISDYKTITTSTNPQIYVDITLSKKIGNWDISLYGYGTWRRFDGKYSMDGKITTSTSEIYSIRHSKGEPLGIQFSLGYNFGNQKLRAARSRDNSGEYKSRVQVND